MHNNEEVRNLSAQLAERFRDHHDAHSQSARFFNYIFTPSLYAPILNLQDFSITCNVLWEWLCCCLQVNYIVYKHFDRSLHIGSLDPTCVQNFRPVPLTFFEILGFKLKNKNNDNYDKKSWRNRRFAISPVFVVQFSPNIK